MRDEVTGLEKARIPCHAVIKPVMPFLASSLATALKSLSYG
jgi:hypothetical protein